MATYGYNPNFPTSQGSGIPEKSFGAGPGGLLGAYLQMQQILRARAQQEQAGKERSQMIEGVQGAQGDAPKAIEALLRAGTPEALILAEKLKGLVTKPQEPTQIVPSGAAIVDRASGAERYKNEGLPKEEKPPLIQPNFPVGGNKVQPHISFDKGQNWSPLPGSKPSDKFASSASIGSPGSDAVVDAIIDGRMAVPTGFAIRSPYWQDILERVAKKDPKFDATLFSARQRARGTFASGPEARNVTALNTVIGHLGTLDEAADALNNRKIPAANAVLNRLAKETGDPRIVNFETARFAVAEETMRVFRQVGASEGEAKRWGDTIKTSSSPVQLRGAIATIGKLLESRVEAIAQQYERTVNQSSNPAQVDPKNKEILKGLIKQGQPNWGEEKEKRYQELLRKRSGS